MSRRGPRLGGGISLAVAAAVAGLSLALADTGVALAAGGTGAAQAGASGLRAGAATAVAQAARPSAAWHWSDRGTPGTGLLVNARVGVTTVMDSPGAPQRPYAWVIGSDRHLWLNWWDGSAWHWSDMGTPGTGLVTAGVGVTTVMDSPSGPQRPYAWVIGSDRHLWTNWWDGSAWHWSDMGTPGTGLVTAGVGVTTVMDSPSGPQRPYAWVIGNSGHLWTNWWDGSAWHWSDMGTPGTGLLVDAGVGVTTVMDSPGAPQRPYAWVIGSDRHQWTNWWDGHAWHWSHMGRPGTGLVDAGVGVTTVMDSPSASQRPYAWVIGNSRHLWANWWDGSAWHWSHLGTPGTGLVDAGVGVTTVTDSPGSPQRPYAWVIGSDRHLWLNWWG